MTDGSLRAALQAKVEGRRKNQAHLSAGQARSAGLANGLSQQSTTPQLKRPAVVVFASDHGIAREGGSAYSPEVTRQMVLNFLSGGAAINVFCRQHGLDLKVVDSGVDFDFLPAPGLINCKVARGTRSLLDLFGLSVNERERTWAAIRNFILNKAKAW